MRSVKEKMYQGMPYSFDIADITICDIVYKSFLRNEDIMDNLSDVLQGEIDEICEDDNN